MILVYITNKDEQEAKKIAAHLLKKNLIACANMFPIQSLYRWKGRMRDEQEVVLITKTQQSKFNSIKKEVKKIHSYDTPCILKINATPNTSFWKWVKGETA